MHRRPQGLLITVCLAMTGLAPAQTPVQSATLLLPSAVAYDTAGNLYVADAQRHQVYEFTAAGDRLLIAGNGQQGFSGDGTLAVNASLNMPSALAIAPDGTLYIADSGNHRIRRIVAGRIDTIAGGSASGSTGDAASATLATLRTPAALAMSATGTLYIADAADHRIRAITNGVITTVAGTGTQGFTGDGAPALAATLDSPSGLAVAPDGTLYLADTHNQRIRAIGTDGIIHAIAGDGQRADGGDGSLATAGHLCLPHGLAFNGSTLLIADLCNRRIRTVDSAGTLATLAGNGAQGVFAEGGVAALQPLDAPIGIAMSPTGLIAIADEHTSSITLLTADGTLHALGSTAASTALTLAPIGALVYGNATLITQASSTAVTPQGTITLSEAGVAIVAAPLHAGAATLPISTLAAGTHRLVVAYAGDGLHAATTATLTAFITPLVVSALAADITIRYGDALPKLTGTLSGILPADAASVAVTFSTSAPALADVGTYPLTPTLSGASSANYTVQVATGSGSLHVLQAAPGVALQASATSYAGLPVTLSTTVSPATRGLPTGNIQFQHAGVPFATAKLVAGQATAVFSPSTQGQQTFTTTYTGDINFSPASSQSATVNILPMPDFTLSSATNLQTVQQGAIASYALYVTATDPAFSGTVTFSVKGLPAGAITTFTPPMLIPGTSPVLVTLAIQTPIARIHIDSPFAAVLFALFFLVPALRLRRNATLLLSLILIVAIAAGCGDRTVGSGAAPTTSTLEISATSTNLAGSTVVHTTQLTLVTE